MKNYLLFIIITCLSLAACENTRTPKEAKILPFETVQTIPVEGEWTRTFSLGEGSDSLAHVFYRIEKDKIEYEMKGMLPLNYTIAVDTFVAKDNRWVGKLNDVSYTVFVQVLSTDSINLFKLKVENRQVGLDMPVPDTGAKSHFTSWNIFYKTK